jgi:hypothetical protein
MEKFANKDWPSTKKCFEDNRLSMGFVREFSYIEKQKILNFNFEAHQKLQKDINSIAGFFGGQSKNILKFIDFYYDTIKLFIKKKLFIGKEQNIFTFVAFSHPEIINLVFFKNYYGFKNYLQ